MNEIIKQLEIDKELLEISICEYELEEGYSFDVLKARTLVTSVMS